MSHAVIAYIGGGSAGWAVKLMRDLAREPELSGILRLYDIDRPAAETNLELGRRIFAHPDAKASFEVSRRQRSTALTSSFSASSRVRRHAGMRISRFRRSTGSSSRLVTPWGPAAFCVRGGRFPHSSSTRAGSVVTLLTHG